MRVLLVAGGTGGHLIPAIAFGRWLENQGVEWHLITGSRPLEREICQAHGVVARVLPVSGSPLGAGWRQAPQRTWELLKAFRQGRQLFKVLQPQICLLFGGYLSLPLFFAARRSGVTVALHEQNVIAGRVNRLIAQWGCPVLSAWEKCEGIKDFIPVGIPIRPLHLADKQKAQRELLGQALSEGEKLAVVLGGSLGAKGLVNSLSVQSNMVEFISWKFMFIGLTEVPKALTNAFVSQAQWDMTVPYSAADLIICRAGAGTLAEVDAFRLRALVVPWKDAADGHQLANAKLFENKTGTPFWTGNGDFSSIFVQAAERPLKSSGSLGNGSSKLWEALLTIGKRREILP